MADRESVASERLLDQEWEMQDLDWLAETSLIPQRSCSQAVFRGSESDDNDFEYFSDGKKYDFEDLEDKFLFSGLEEDGMLSIFTIWLNSVDGSSKPPTQSNKDKHIVMSVVRHHND